MKTDSKKAIRIPENPGKWFALAGLIVGILLLLAGSLIPDTAEDPQDDITVQYYTESLEKRIQELCTSIHGITEATVLLTLENSGEYVYAQNGDTGSSSGMTWDYVIVNQGEGEEAVMVTEIYPQVRGVAVVCTGGDSAAVQQIVTELLSASLGISSNRIRVAGK